MYATHAHAIQDWARKSPNNLARVIQLSIVSAHAPFSRIVHDMCEDMAARNPKTYRSAHYVSSLHCEALGV